MTRRRNNWGWLLFTVLLVSLNAWGNASPGRDGGTPASLPTAVIHHAASATPRGHHRHSRRATGHSPLRHTPGHEPSLTAMVRPAHPAVLPALRRIALEPLAGIAITVLPARLAPIRWSPAAALPAFCASVHSHSPRAPPTLLPTA